MANVLAGGIRTGGGGATTGTGSGGKDSLIAGGVGGGIVTEACQANPFTNELDCVNYENAEPIRTEGHHWNNLINDINKREYIGVEKFKEKYNSQFIKIAPSLTNQFEYHNCVGRQFGEDISDCLKTDVEPLLKLK